MKYYAALLAVLPLAIAQNATTTVTSASASPSSTSSASKVISINVGEGGLIFSPNSTTANVGDTLQFSFYPMNHSVAQSIFTQPCQPANNAAIFSGFMPVAAGSEGNTTFSVVVNGTNPLWFYCSQGRHCQSGMVFVVNENTASGNTLGAYASAAALAPQNLSPAQVQGGQSQSASNSTSSPTSTATRTAASGSATGTASATGSSSRTVSGASSTPTSGAAVGLSLGWNTLGSAGMAAFVLSALL